MCVSPVHAPAAADPATLPDPELLALVRAGDREAADALVKRHRPLVRRVVGDLNPPARVGRDDCEQEGLLGILRAARGWKPGKLVRGRPVKFSTYLFVIVVREVGDEIQRQLKAPVPLNPRGGDDDGGDDDRRRLDQLAAREPADGPDVAGVLAGMSPIGRGLVAGVFGLDGHPVKVKQLAARFGLTWKQAAEVIDRELAAAREAVLAPVLELLAADAA